MGSADIDDLKPQEGEHFVVKKGFGGSQLGVLVLQRLHPPGVAD